MSADLKVVKTDDGRYDALKAGMPQPMADRVLTPMDCLKPTSRRGYITKGLFSNGDYINVIGHPGCGKSTLVPDIAYAIAQGRPVFGLRTKACKVLYAVAEDDLGMRQRIAALVLRHGDTPNFRMVSIGNLLDKSTAKDLLDYVKAEGVGFVVIDTLGAAFAGIDENSARDMGEVVKFGRSITQTGAAFLIIHHTAKAAGGGGTPRGHGVLWGTLDVCILLEMVEGGICRGKLTKNRNGSCDLDIAFRIGSADLGLDEDDDMITAPIAQVLAAQEKQPPMTPTEKMTLTALRQFKTSHMGVTLADWQSACIATGVSTASRPRDQGRTIKIAIDGLTTKRIVTFNPGDMLYHLKSRDTSASHFNALGPRPGDLHALLH